MAIYAKFWRRASRRNEMLDLFISAFVTLFVVIDPPGCAPIFYGLTSSATAAQARAMAIRASVIAALILVLFALFGEQLLSALHIELNSFRLAGGIMLFLIALEMVFEKRTQRREERAEKIKAQNERTPEVEDISVFPMAIPMIAGPGSIATTMLLMSTAQGTDQTLVILAALAAVLVLCLLALLAARPLMRLMGAQVEAVITRLLGVLLAALAAQYVIDGVRAIIG
jgi:multiple antibiotic resistance protein